MKAITNIFITLMVLGSINFVSAQCGPTKVNPTPQLSGLCEGGSDTISFTALGTCSGNYEYQVRTSTNAVAQSWSTNNQFVHSASTTDTYTVYARCSACPTVRVSDTFLIEVIPTPTIVADTFVCHGTPANFAASGAPAGTMSWWDSPTGGTQLSTTENYTSPPLTAADTVYMRVSGTISGGSNQGSILITECGLEGFPGSPSADYLEVSNLYATPVNTSGWVVAISDSYSDINIVNNTLWNLPGSFSPCSMLSKTDVSSQPNYWGENMYWLSGQPGWVAIVDDAGNLIDFIAWGWTAAQIASFNVNINGFNITVGTEWSGNGCNSTCTTVGGVPYSFSRTGNSDNNNAGDFTCQATSLNGVNPGLNCGWISTNITCPYPAIVTVDSFPTASAPDTTEVDCYTDIPASDPSIITDEQDDQTSPLSVQFMGEVSNGNVCPEILTRTYRVTDSCSNFIEVDHIIIINDTVAPTMEPAPADVQVSCYSDVPPMDSLSWTDNCLGSGKVAGVAVSDGKSCPETITRTWTATDGCGNTSTETQVVVINDDIYPTASNLPTLQLSVLPPADISLVTDAADNCGTPLVEWVSDSSDNGFCPENIIRTYSVTDDCGNATYVTRKFIIGGSAPNVSFTADPSFLDNLSSGLVEFTNTTTGAVSYTWDFGDNSPLSNEMNPSHQFDISSSTTYNVWLKATSELDCSDSVNLAINVFQELIYFVPNSFTPNDDGVNQTFKPIFVSGFDIYDYNLLVYNRWGEILFESKNHEVGWDGTYNGKSVQQGTYIYKIEFGMEHDDSRKVVTGHFTLLK